jgi:hypothetical protein
MMRKILSRAISAFILMVFFAGLSHLYHARIAKLGREVYLEKQGVRFDRHYAHLDSIFLELFSALVLIFIALVVYEFIAFIIRKILEQIKSDAPGAL